jgi:hypothetical protein
LPIEKIFVYLLYKIEGKTAVAPKKRRINLIKNSSREDKIAPKDGNIKTQSSE